MTSAVVQAVATTAPRQPDFDGLATSFAALGAAIAWGSLVLVLVIAAASLGWGFIFRRWALEAARRGAADFLVSPEGRDHLRQITGSGVASGVSPDPLRSRSLSSSATPPSSNG